MTGSSFQDALSTRVGDMLEACTRCGACVSACPVVSPAGLGDVDPKAVIQGVLDIVRSGQGPEAAQKWAHSCMLSGECITACQDGVNPRFLLATARVQMARHANDPAARRQQGVAAFRKLTEDVGVLSQLQLTAAQLERLGQGHSTSLTADELPDVVFYTGCNVLKTPHIALLCLDIMDALAIKYRVLGGPANCCGVQQWRAGDTESSSRVAGNSITRLSQSRTGQVLAWCPSCFVQFTENTLPTIELATGSRPFDMTPFMRYLHSQLDRLRPFLLDPVPLRVALHRHSGVPGVAQAAEELLRAVPGIELVELHQPAVGLQSVSLATLPAYKRGLQLNELEAARVAGVDALVSVYHSDHRELCAHERDWPFQILNVLEIVGESMGLRQNDQYKHLKMLQDVDSIVNDCSDLIAEHGLDGETARRVIEIGMLGDQPLPLQGPREPASKL